MGLSLASWPTAVRWVLSLASWKWKSVSETISTYCSALINIDHLFFDCDSFTYLCFISKECDILKANAVLAGGDDALVEAAFQYGRHIGIAFQLVDDLLDFTSSAEQLGRYRYQTVFRIRIDLIRIQGFMTKNGEKFTAEKIKFFGPKTTIYLSLGSIKDLQDTEEAFSSQKRTSSI